MTSTVGNALPAGSPEGRFLAMMVMARARIEPAAWRAAEANRHGAPDFVSQVVSLTSTLYEAVAALRAYRQTHPEVQARLRGLPTDRDADLRLVVHLDQRLGPGVHQRLRHAASHFPAPGREGALLEALRAHADQPLTVSLDSAERRVHIDFADQLFHSIAFGGFAENDRALRSQLKAITDAALAFVRVSDALIAAHQAGFEVTQREANPPNDRNPPPVGT